jgi:hypothetical protein
MIRGLSGIEAIRLEGVYAKRKLKLDGALFILIISIVVGSRVSLSKGHDWKVYPTWKVTDMS